MQSAELSLSKATRKDAEEKHLELRFYFIYEQISFDVESLGKHNASRPSTIELLFGIFLKMFDSGKASKVAMINKVIFSGRYKILNEGGS